MKVTMLLCDAAQASEGKLYILGGGWEVMGAAPTPSAVALLIQVPWDQTDRHHEVVLELLTEDGEPVVPAGSETPVRIATGFGVARPPGHAPGAPLSVPFAINVSPLPLSAGMRYCWQLSIGGQTHEDWRLPFAVRAMPQGSD